MQFRTHRTPYRHLCWLPVVVFILGVVSSGLLIWSMRINERQRMNFALADAIMDMQFQIVSSHLWFEEIINGDTAENIDGVWASIDHGLHLARAILKGGPTEHGFVLEPLESESLRTDADEIISLAARFKAITRQRYENIPSSGIGSELDTQLDAIYRSFTQKAGALEEFVEKDHARNQIKSRQLLIGILVGWSLIVLAATAGLWSRERRRVAAELALLVAHERLQLQAKELEEHRAHLIERVEERTAELTASNKELQREIIEHKETLGALEESRDRFEKLSIEFDALLNAIPDSIILISPELRVMWANNGAIRFLGGGVFGDRNSFCHEERPGASGRCDPCPARGAFLTGKPQSAQIATSDGAVWDVRAIPILAANSKVENVIEVARDITEKLALQAESIRVAHLASLGELAAGVAHEINNPINGIINYAEILIDESGKPPEKCEIPNRIIKEGNRIATIVRSLLSFAHQSNRTERSSVQLQEVLSDALALCGKQMEKDGICVRVDVPDDLPVVTASPHQIEQVFLNIINNARYALNQKYQGMNRDKLLEIQGAVVVGNGLSPQVEITFHDKGVGIPAVIAGKIMDPFFSTKPKGVGTGLGLSISHGIISDHGGRIVTRSVENEYTTVRVIFPVGTYEGERDGSQGSCHR